MAVSVLPGGVVSFSAWHLLQNYFLPCSLGVNFRAREERRMHPGSAQAEVARA